VTYLLISVPFLAAAALLWWVRRGAHPGQGRVTLAVTTVMAVLTIVFDNLMVAAGLMQYDTSNNMGVRLGLIPVEDLFYTVFVCLVVTSLWPRKAP